MRTSVWDLAPCPVVVADPSGAVVGANDAAGLLLPGAAPGAPVAEVAPAWLAEAHRAVCADAGSAAPTHPDRTVPDPVAGRIGVRSFEAHPSLTADGSVVWWLVDDTGRRLAEEALATERERTRLLSETSHTLLTSLNTDRCMATTAELAAEHLADIALVVVAPAQGRTLSVARALAGQEAERVPLAGAPSDLPGLAEALQGFPPAPSRWIDPAAMPAWVLPEGFGATIGSVVVTPLPGHGVPAGALVLLRRSGRAEFSESDEVFARLFGARAGAALSAARLYSEQNAITRILMRDLLPPALPRLDGVEIAGGYRPAGATEPVGGDFYDVHPGSTPADASLVVLGDVCGKGLEAAVLTGKIRNTLQALLPMADDHPRMLGLLNGALLNSHHTRFVTLVLASVHRAGDEVRLRLTSAGHPHPLVVRADGTVEQADTHGSLIGVLPTIEARTVETVLRQGDTCLLHTDGFTEARGGPRGDELFGDERLRHALSECAGMPPEAVVDHIQMLASQWVRGGPHDDMAVIAIGAPRGVHPARAVDGRGRGRSTG
ncbi:PP2C family protein-serine/threonine phosphatase [uncultured Streptomyces sp.]|uniref:PP2C family protein-serine/threonine phosphatase n=1 Tax=uncultured Streptomyces sp. TaxID=174707 RepID=UPI00261BA43F|nr:PP2C family protein-serine/threonine phosphatase [uncultured Streptomyces sp.]